MTFFLYNQFDYNCNATKQFSTLCLDDINLIGAEHAISQSQSDENLHDFIHVIYAKKKKQN